MNNEDDPLGDECNNLSPMETLILHNLYSLALYEAYEHRTREVATARDKHAKNEVKAKLTKLFESKRKENVKAKSRRRK